MKKRTSHCKSFKQKIGTVVEELLKGYTPRKLTDDKVIRDAVFGFNVFFRHEINIIDSPLIQRLRRIHQTALAVLTYPSSTHTRFEHSLGVMVIADKMVRTINDKHPTTIINQIQRAEVRLAAILHDCGHGPFSHVSEAVYGNTPYEIPVLKEEEKSLFGTANPHEIVTYFVITSKAFKKLWEKIVDLYDPRTEKLLCVLKEVNLDRVALMILGKKAENYPQYISQIINGPFDADKFDYIIRDGYFTGLVTQVDIERLFISLDWVPFSEHRYQQYQEDVLCMDIGGATVLEQLLFNKMILYSSFYHHHKVRAAFRLLVHLWELLLKNKLTLKGIYINESPNFLLLDDGDLLSADAREYPKEIKQLITDIKNRNLPMRALVITKDALLDDQSRVEYFRLRDLPESRTLLEKQIAKEAGGVTRVFIDFPEEPGFVVSGVHSLIKLGPKRYVTLDKLYPASGWVSGYAEYRYRSYVFSPPGKEIAIKREALKVFENASIRLDKFLTAALAKMPPED